MCKKIWHVPRESLKGGGKVVRPAKVKNLVVKTRDVVASFRQVEDLRGREEGGGGRRGKEGGREGRRRRGREREGRKFKLQRST